MECKNLEELLTDGLEAMPQYEEVLPEETHVARVGDCYAMVRLRRGGAGHPAISGTYVVSTPDGRTGGPFLPPLGFRMEALIRLGKTLSCLAGGVHRTDYDDLYCLIGISMAERRVAE